MKRDAPKSRGEVLHDVIDKLITLGDRLLGAAVRKCLSVESVHTLIQGVERVLLPLVHEPEAEDKLDYVQGIIADWYGELDDQGKP